MAEGNTSEGLSKSRSVLGDLTNRLAKRRISEKEKNGIKSFDFNDKDALKRIRVSPRPCTGINSLKGNVISSISKIPNENQDPKFAAVSNNSIDVNTDSDDGHCLKGRNVVLSNSKLDGENMDIVILGDPKLDDVPKSVNKLDVAVTGLVDSCGKNSEDNGVPRMDNLACQNYEDPNLTNLEGVRAVNSIAVKADDRVKLDVLKKNGIVGISEVLPENKCPSLKHSLREIVSIEANDELGERPPVETSRALSEPGGEAKMNLEDTQNDYKKKVDDYNVDSFVLSQSGSFDCTILPESQESRVFEADRSTELKKGDECAHMSGGTDSINTCSCSFCTKDAMNRHDCKSMHFLLAISCAYMVGPQLSGHQGSSIGILTYLLFKIPLAMKKSQKEASILAERSCRSKATEKHGAESFGRTSKLESHLMYQWRSLFQHMARIWEEESNQLEASLLPLTDLREKCKNGLETINPTPPEKH
ncbi:hypothetical protein BUALT_Bualt04G0019700 [Buddleja alternifolia]|uniref:Uncharacterized protein n=1 Tax=Buddleja alternifolia TaxID=168488 RepID=A0AAV6XW87_9LAMI|nr:hypothetical protein BUALT_Bualt04G0019700 [Buddleja alternifolia]